MKIVERFASCNVIRQQRSLVLILPEPVIEVRRDINPFESRRSPSRGWSQPV